MTQSVNYLDHPVASWNNIGSYFQVYFFFEQG